MTKAKSSRMPQRLVSILIVMVLLTMGVGRALAAGLTTQDLSTGITANDLASALVGEGVAISNVTLKADSQSAGQFAGGAARC